MTLYQLIQHDWDFGSTNHGIFTTRALAEEAARRLGLVSWDIEESEADVLPEDHGGRRFKLPTMELDPMPTESSPRIIWCPPGYEAAARKLLEQAT